MPAAPKPAPRGFFTDRSPPAITKADEKFKDAIGRYPNAKEAELAPREGHVLDQVADFNGCPLAEAYPQWETFLFDKYKPLRRPIKEVHDLSGPSVGAVNRQFGTCEKKCDEL